MFNEIRCLIVNLKRHKIQQKRKMQQAVTEIRIALTWCTIGKAVKVLHAPFKSAVKNEFINPACDLELPKIVNRLIKPPGKKDVLAILKRAPEEH